jgi:hypothetical protein
MPNMIATRQLIFVLGLAAVFQTRAAVAQQPGETPVPDTEPPYVEPLTEPMAVIPPGREDVLAEMLGRGATLPDGCAFARGQVTSDTVTATYTCPAGEAVFTLRHPSKAPSGATLSERFALSLQSGSPPAALAEELLSRIRAREATFEWTWVGSYASGGSTQMTIIIIAALAAGGLLFLLLRRRSRQATRS